MKFYLALIFTLIFGGFMFAGMLASTVWWMQAIFGLLTMLSMIFLMGIFVNELIKASKQ